MSALRELLVIFGSAFDPSGLEEGQKKTDGAVSAIKGALAGLGTLFAIREVKQFTSDVLQEADALAKASIGLGLSAQELQELEHAAGLSGVGVEALRGSLARLQKGAAEAADKGTSPVAEAFKKLGIPLKDASGQLRTSGDLFTDAAGAIGAIKNPTEAAGVAAAIFGKSYAPLLPLFKEGKEGIAKLRGEVKELGFGFDEAFLEDAQEVNDNMDRLHKGIRGVGIQLISGVLPHLVQFSQWAVKVTKVVVDWVRHTNILQTALVLLTGKGIIALSRALGPLGSLLKGLGSSFLRTALPIAALALLVDELISTFNGGDTLIRRFIDSLFGVGATDEVVKELKAIWVDFTTVVLPNAIQIGKDLARELGQAWQDFSAFVKQVFADFGAWLSDFWTTLPGPLQDVLSAIGDMFSSAFNWIGDQISGLIDKFNPLKQLFGAIDDNANANARAEADARHRHDADPAYQNAQRKLLANVGRGVQAGGASVFAPRPAAGATVSQQVHVTVPPGTPANMADRVGQAAARGQRQANKATHNALAFKPA